jgi:hypothetical protein
VGPWILIYTLVPLVALQGAVFADGKIGSFFDPVSLPLTPPTALWILFSIAIASFFAFPLSTLWWHRFALEYRPPKSLSPLPSRSTLKYFYIFIMINVVAGQFEKMMSPDLKTFAANNGFLPPTLVVECARVAFWTAALWLFGSFALLLPAAAVGDAQMNLTLAGRRAIALRAPFRNGLILTFIPALILANVLGTFLENLPGLSLSVQQLFAFGPDFIFFAGLAAAATYLARAYRASADILPDAQAVPSLQR